MLSLQENLCAFARTWAAWGEFLARAQRLFSWVSSYEEHLTVIVFSPGGTPRRSRGGKQGVSRRD
jgi:hypothetical protein